MARDFLQDPMLVWSLSLIAGIAAMSTILFTCYRYYYPKLQQTQRLWDDILLKALHLPVQIVLWVFAITYASELLHIRQDILPLTFIEMRLRDFVLVLCVFWFFLRYISYFEQRIADKPLLFFGGGDKSKWLSFSRFMRVTVIFLGLLVVVQACGVPISGLLAFGGMGALIIGLAAKDLLANFFGGLLIYADRPFTMGDWISSPDKDIEGIVEHIGWRLTLVRRFDKRVLYIPNSIFSNITLENGSKMTHRRILFSMHLRFQDMAVADALCEQITAILAQHEQLDQTSSYFAKLDGFAANGIKIKIQTYTQEIDNDKFLVLQHSLFLQIAKAVKQAGAEFAYPT